MTPIRNTPSPLMLASTAIAVALITACGGGGDDEPTVGAMNAGPAVPVVTTLMASSPAPAPGAQAQTLVAKAIAPTAEAGVAGPEQAPGGSYSGNTTADATIAVAATPALAMQAAPSATPTSNGLAQTPPAKDGGAASSADAGVPGPEQLPTAATQARSRLDIDPRDVLAQLHASRAFSTYGWQWALECAGTKSGLFAVPETGLFHTDVGGAYGAQRFGKASDPDEAGRSVFLFRANVDDPALYGAPRCEASTSPTAGGALPLRQTLWFAFGMRLQEWSHGSDEQIVAQWHQGDGSTPLNPFMAISLKGTTLLVTARHNNAKAVSKASSTVLPLASVADTPTDRWVYIVVQARIGSDPADNGFLRVWRDGAQIVDHSGPLGYNLPAFAPYLKLGHYHWLDGNNTWPRRSSTRSLLMRTPTLIVDAASRYSESDVRDHVSQQ